MYYNEVRTVMQNSINNLYIGNNIFNNTNFLVD